MADKQITRRLTIYVNGAEVDATISNLSKSLAKFRAQSNRAVEGTPEWKKYNAEVAKLELELNDARDAQKAFRKETKITELGVDQATESLGDLTSGFSDVFQGLKKGDYLQASKGFNAIGTGIKGATRAAWAFIATPIGAAIAVLTGIAAAVKIWVDYNDTIKESVILTEQITRLQGEAADAARLRATALEETFGIDFQENLKTAQKLVVNFGISYDEAFNVIEDGLIKGQKNNNEYFESLKEYPVFFAAAGFSAQEFQNIVSAGFDLGIYNDKLPDAIKEFDISLREQTTSTRDALLNAFGAPFTDDLLARVKRGETTTKQALQEIAAEAEKTGINIQQNAQLTADLFRGAGEDAGGAVKVLEAVRKAAQDATRALTPLEASLKEVADANLELAKAQDEALKSDNYVSFTRDLQIFWTKTKTVFFNGVKFITDKLTEVSEFSISFLVSLGVTAQSLPGILKDGVNDVALAVLNTIKTFGGLGDVVTKLLALDFTGAKEAAVNFKDNFTEAFNGVKTAATDTAKEILNAQQVAQNLVLEDFDKRRAGAAEANALENPEDPGLTTTDKPDATKKEELTPEDKRKLASRKRLADLLKEFEEEQKIQEELKKLEEEDRAEEEEVLRLEDKFAKLTEEAEGETELITGLEEAKQFQLQQIRDKYAKIRTDKATEEAKKLEKDQKVFLEKRLKAEENYQRAKEKALFVGLDILKNIFGQESAIAKLMLGIEKAFAIASIISNTSKAIGVATANEAAIPAVLPPGIPNPIKPYSLATTATNIAAAKISAAVQIASIISTTIKSLDQGGETFSGQYSGGVDGKGGRLIIAHPEEYVIPKFVRKSPEVPQIIEYLEAKRTGALPSFDQGGEANPVSQTGNTENNATLLALASALNRLVDEGVTATALIGDDEIKRQTARDKKLSQTRTKAKINN